MSWEGLTIHTKDSQVCSEEAVGRTWAEELLHASGLIGKNSDGKIEQGGMECKKEDYLGGCCQNPDKERGN